MRRRRIFWVIAAICALALSGCAKGWGISTGSSGGKVELTYSLWDPTEQIGYQKSIDEFEKQHPNIHVTIEQIPYGSYQPKLTSEFISHQGPDGRSSHTSLPRSISIWPVPLPMSKPRS